MKIVIMVFIVSLFLLSACDIEPSRDERVEGRFSDKLTIYTRCDDNIVCYYHDGGNDGGMDCFRDEDLVAKYCCEYC